jgi:SAM-dependent methyltransferase
MGAPDDDKMFAGTGDAYDRFMGRYSRPLATAFADAAGVAAGSVALDVGCGPGALTGELVGRVGSESVVAIDPSESFVIACAERHPGVEVRQGGAEEIPFGDSEFDVALAQLVLHFVSDAERAAAELRRVLRPGGTVGACVWDFDGGMTMLRHFWDAALAVDPTAPDEASTMRFGREGEIAELFDAAGFEQVVESTLQVSARYVDFDDLWSSCSSGVGPVGAHVEACSETQRSALRDELFIRVGSPPGAFELSAMARCVVARSPLGAVTTFVAGGGRAGSPGA